MTLTEDQMRKDNAQNIYQAENYLYQIEKNWIDQQAQAVLFAQAAKDAGMSQKDWEVREIDTKAPAPADPEVEQLMKQSGRPAASTGTAQYQTDFTNAKNYLINQKKLQVRNQVYRDLQKKYPVQILIEKPIAPRVNVSYAPDDPVKGNPKAPVTILEFTDYQCPFCQRSQEVLRQIEKTYPETVKLVARQFPLAFHNRAKPAAEAVLCAKEQGKYWPYRDRLFEKQQLSDEDFLRYARELKMSIGKFQKCLAEHRYAGRIETDIADGQRFGVTGTPAFFINGQFISGAQPFDAFNQAIQDALVQKPAKDQK